MEAKSCRKVCTSVLFPREEEAGGQFVLTPQGYERAAWFIPLNEDHLDSGNGNNQKHLFTLGTEVLAGFVLAGVFFCCC